MGRVLVVLAMLFKSLPSAASYAQSDRSTGASPSRGLGLEYYIGGSVAPAYFAEIEGAEYDLGFAVSALAGLESWWGYRFETELTYETASFQNSVDDTSLFRLSGNFYSDFQGLGNWVPYAGGGLGIVDVDVGNDTDNIELSGHLEGGISIPIGSRLHFVPSLRVEYILLENIDDQVITQFRVGLRRNIF